MRIIPAQLGESNFSPYELFLNACLRISRIKKEDWKAIPFLLLRAKYLREPSTLRWRCRSEAVLSLQQLERVSEFVFAVQLVMCVVPLIRFLSRLQFDYQKLSSPLLLSSQPSIKSRSLHRSSKMVLRRFHELRRTAIEMLRAPLR